MSLKYYQHTILFLIIVLFAFGLAILQVLEMAAQNGAAVSRVSITQ